MKSLKQKWAEALKNPWWWTLLAYIILLLWSANVFACEAHWFARAAIGTQGQWLQKNPEWIGEDEIATAFRIGYKWESGFGIELSHNSHLFFDVDNEDELDALTFGYEWRF